MSRLANHKFHPMSVDSHHNGRLQFGYAGFLCYEFLGRYRKMNGTIKEGRMKNLISVCIVIFMVIFFSNVYAAGVKIKNKTSEKICVAVKGMGPSWLATGDVKPKNTRPFDVVTSVIYRIQITDHPDPDKSSFVYNKWKHSGIPDHTIFDWFKCDWTGNTLKCKK